VKILILSTLLFFNATLFAQTAYSNPNHSAAVLATASFGALTRPRLPVPPQWSAPELTQMWAIASELPWTVAENEQPAGTKSFSFPPQPRGCAPVDGAAFLRPDSENGTARGLACALEEFRLPQLAWPQLNMETAGGPAAQVRTSSR